MPNRSPYKNLFFNFNNMNYKTCLIILGLAIASNPISANASPLQPTANPVEQSSSQKSDLQPEKTPESTNNFNSFSSSFKPPDKGQPKYTIGGATRGDTCAIEREDQNEITALVPAKNQSLTLESRPSLFAYVSPTYGNKPAILIVKDETEDYYYSQQLTLPESGGIVKMTLAEDAPQLEVNKDYTWFLRIQCNAYLQPEDPQISASIMRVEGNTPDLDRSDLVSFYADSQIWYDSLNSAFELFQFGEDVYLSELLNNVNRGKLIAE